VRREREPRTSHPNVDSALFLLPLAELLGVLLALFLLARRGERGATRAPVAAARRVRICDVRLAFLLR
jgi:hypothetical protein